MLRRRYQIFISSTYKDLIKEREAVIKAILQNYNFPIGMEMFHADNEEQWIQIANPIELSDYYVVILGNCCGTLLRGENRSYTEKEYDFAVEKGIPVLAFVIDSKVPTVHFEETAHQRQVYKKFRAKVDKLPRMTWQNKDDLALKVITTINAKIAEGNRNGWIPYNSAELMPRNEISPDVAGDYEVIYLSALGNTNKHLIFSKLSIDTFGNVSFINNLNFIGDSEGEYCYHGVCSDSSGTLYIHLKNDNSEERVIMSLIKSVGKLSRLIGLLMASTSYNTPVCVKVVCYKTNMATMVNLDIIEKLLWAKNTLFNEQTMVVEDNEKMLFFSDGVLNKKIPPD